MIAGGAVRVVLELAGVKNGFGKQLGSGNPLNNARATIEGLKSMRTWEEVRRRRSRRSGAGACGLLSNAGTLRWAAWLRFGGHAVSSGPGRVCSTVGLQGNALARLPSPFRLSCRPLCALQVASNRGLTVADLMGRGAGGLG